MSHFICFRHNLRPEPSPAAKPLSPRQQALPFARSATTRSNIRSYATQEVAPMSPPSQLAIVLSFAFLLASHPTRLPAPLRGSQLSKTAVQSGPTPIMDFVPSRLRSRRQVDSQRGTRQRRAAEFPPALLSMGIVSDDSLMIIAGEDHPVQILDTRPRAASAAGAGVTTRESAFAHQARVAQLWCRSPAHRRLSPARSGEQVGQCSHGSRTRAAL